jgi:hypothetical protein
MKNIKDTIKKVITEAKGAYVPDDAVHFKMGSDKKSKTKEEKTPMYHKGAYVPDEPIHFKMGSDKKSTKTRHHVKEEHHEYTLYKWKDHNDNSHLGRDDNEISEKLKEKTKKFDSSEQKNAVKDYTKNSSDVNDSLIEHHKDPTAHINSHHNDKIKGLDTATNHPIGHHVSLYSGLGFNPANHITGENHVHLPAFTSMTHNKHVADNFAQGKSYKFPNEDRHILHLHMRPEDKGIHIPHVSEYDTEHETILPRRTTIKIHHEPEIYHDSEGKKVHIWHSHIHHQY